MSDSEALERPLLVLISVGMQRYREYLLRSIVTRYRVHLINTVEPTWEQPYLAGHTVPDELDTAGTVAAVRAVARAERVAGVLSWDESKIVQTAWAARELGLPGGDPEAVLRCRDKYQTRCALDAAGVGQPACALVGDLDAALAAAAEIGYPVVLKPRAASASYGVVLVSDAVQLTRYFDYTRETSVPHMPRYDSEVLVEEYLADPEISVDGAVFRGRVLPAFLGRKEIGFPPYFEETGHSVSGADPLLCDPDLLRALQATHDALGFRDGWTHTELKLTAEGPKVIEVNGRLGGDLIPYVGMRASGIDPGLAAADVAVGREPDMTAGRALHGGVRFCYVDRDESVIDSIGFEEDALPPGLDLAVALASPGDVVSRPPAGLVSGRIAFITAMTPAPDETRALLDRAQAALRVEAH